MRKIILAYLFICASLFAAWQCFSAPVTLTGAGFPGGAGGAVAYKGPVDCTGCPGTAPVICYSFFACSGAIATAGTQPMVQLKRASDGQSCQFLPITTGKLGNAGNPCSGAFTCTAGASCVSTFCASTTCTVTRMFNQMGGTNFSDVAQSTTPPNFTLSSSIGGNPAATGTATTLALDGSAMSNAALPTFSTSTVLRQTALNNPNGQSFWGWSIGGMAERGITATTTLAFFSSTNLTSTSADTLPHATQVICVGTTGNPCLTSTSYYVDAGTPVTGTTNRGVSGSDVPNLMELFNGRPVGDCLCDLGEFVLWGVDNTSNVTAINTNVHAANRWNF